MLFSHRCLLATLVAVASITLQVQAVKDDGYYSTGTYNPNVNDSHYWAQPHNILQDLDQFSSLYVSYSSCAWSALEGDEEGGGGGDDDNWYLGSLPGQGANVAYTLYGVLKTDRLQSWFSNGSNHCKKGTYINSFYTKSGLDAFVYALNLAGVEAFATDDDGSGDSAFTSLCNGGDSGDNGDDDDGDGSAKSSGLGCMDGNFVQREYSASYCQSGTVIAVTDLMETLNEDLNAASCVKIYDADAAGDDDNSGDGGYSGALSVLGNSVTCTYHDLVGSCPDPYGKLHHYDTILRKAVGTNNQRAAVRHSYAWGVAMLLASVACLVLSTLIAICECRVSRKGRDITNKIGAKAMGAHSYMVGKGTWREEAVTSSKRTVKSKKSKKSADDDDQTQESVGSEVVYRVPLTRTGPSADASTLPGHEIVLQLKDKEDPIPSRVA